MEKTFRRMLAALLACIAVVSSCIPALAASGEKAGSLRSEKATVEDLIEMDRDYLERVYQAVEAAGRKSSLPVWNEHTMLWGIASILLSQAQLVSSVSRSDFQNVAESLKTGKDPTPLAETIQLTISKYDLYLLRNVLKDSLPARGAVISEPDSTVTKQLKENGGLVAPNQEYDVEPLLMKSLTSMQIYEGRPVADGPTHYAFYPEGVVFVQDYAVVTFYISYTGNTSLTIDGISQIELKDKRTGKVFAGGTASEALGDNRFANPIHFDKGEGAWFAIIFAPGTWYDLNIPDLYSESGEENCAVQAVVTNYHAEAAQ